MGVIEARRRILLTTPHAVTTTPAPVASFDTDMVGKLRSAKFAFLPVQSGSGDPSPTNVRPISGWDGVTVELAGKNLLKSVILQGGVNGDNGTLTENNKQIRTDISCYKAGNYVISNSNSEFYVRIFVYALDGTYIRSESRYAWQIPPHSFSLVGDRLVIFNWSAADSSVITPSDLINPQLELGSIATPYTPYTGSTHPVTWQSAGTIYGGYVDVCKGVVVAEWVSCSFEGDVCSTLWYDVDSSRDTLGFYRNANIWSNTDYPTPVDGGGIFDYCKVGTVYNENTPWVARFLFMNGSFNRFEMRLPKSVLADITSESAAKQSVVSYLDAHPLQAVYKISPITYALTPTIIKSLRGANNLWSNANGDATITYWTH